MTVSSLVRVHNLCLTYHQTPSQYLRLTSDDEPFVSWRKPVGGKVVSYWVFCIDQACALAAQHEDERKRQEEEAEKQRQKLLEGLHGG